MMTFNKSEVMDRIVDREFDFRIRSKNPSLLSGYVLALYDMGILSSRDVIALEQKYGFKLDVCPFMGR